MESKQALRERLRHDRKLKYMPDSWLHILRAPEIITATHVASYLSYDFEPSTEDINKELLRTGKQLYLPRLLPDHDLEWVSWNGAKTDLAKKGKIFEPKGVAIGPEEMTLISVVIVPALHIDRLGNRLGQGGGSYDRALSKFSGWKVGLVHFGEMNGIDIPTETHDQKLDAAATPHILARFAH
ncbi:MAG: 5-formyltetrahydrofolate cyclo-ligase [Actinomycetes bacterium]